MMEDENTDDQIDQFPDLPAYNSEQASGENNNKTRKSHSFKREWDFPFFPGVGDVFKDVLATFHFKTLKEYDTNKEAMYIYVPPENESPNRGIYKRCEPDLKRIIETVYHKLLEDMIAFIERRTGFWGDNNDEITKLKEKLNTKRYHQVVTSHEVNEVMDVIRRNTFTNRSEMNPTSHIPCMNGVLNVKTWKLEPFNPDLFFTWNVQGDYNPDIRSLNDVPKFRDYLFDVFYPPDIPLVLQYMAYSLYPDFPRQKIMAILGQERRGKGTLVRILRRAIPEGSGTISLKKLLTDDKFSLQDIEDKNLLIDFEIKRSYKSKPDFSTVNSLFGGDTLPLEKKFKAEINYISRSKGLLLGNIPLFHVNDAAFLARLLIVVPKLKKKGWKEIVNLDKIIWEEEGTKIVSLLLNLLPYLVKNKFKFANEKTDKEYGEIWESSCDTVQDFIDESLTETKNYVDVEEAYELYKIYCEDRGITSEPQHEFVKKVAKVYPRKRIRENGNLITIFQNCSFSVFAEIDETRKDEDFHMDDI